MDNKDSLGLFLAGAIIGAAIGILFAPKSGKETREDLKELSDDIAEKLKEKGKVVVDENKGKVVEAVNKIKNVVKPKKEVKEIFNNTDEEELIEE